MRSRVGYPALSSQGENLLSRRLRYLCAFSLIPSVTWKDLRILLPTVSLKNITFHIFFLHTSIFKYRQTYTKIPFSHRNPQLSDIMSSKSHLSNAIQCIPVDLSINCIGFSFEGITLTFHCTCECWLARSYWRDHSDHFSHVSSYLLAMLTGERRIFWRNGR